MKRYCFTQVCLGICTLLLLISCTSKEVKLAKEYMEASMYEQAIQLLEIEIQTNPKNAEANYLLGKCYLQTSDFRNVEEPFKKAILLDPSYKEEISSVYYDKAFELFKIFDFGNAESFLEEGLNYNPEYRETFAKELFNQVSESSKTNAETKGNIELFRRVYQISPELDNKIAERAYDLAQEYINKGFIDDGLEYAEFGIEYSPKHIKDVATLYFDVAIDLIEVLNKPKESIWYFERCIVLDPNRKTEIGNLYYNLANDYKAQSEVSLMIFFAQRTVENNSDYESWYLELMEEYKPMISIADLIAYYPFNGNANDESGNGKHGTVEGATLAPDRFGNPNSAYSFDGTDDRIVIPRHDYTNKRSKTYSLWFKTDDVNDEGYFLHAFETTNVTSFAILFYPQNGKDAIMLNYGVENGFYNWFGFSNSKNIRPNTWYMITAVYNAGKGCQLFLNGIELANSTNLKSYRTRPQGVGPITIGCFGSAWYMDMVMDDLIIWDRALSGQEIHDLFYSDGLML